MQESSGKVTLLTKEDYEATMAVIDTLMKKGEVNLTTQEAETLSVFAEAAELYEDTFEQLRIKSE